MIKMNAACHAIATAKQSPIYFRLRSHHIGNGPGNSIWTEDAATTRNMNGTAHRTENPIIDDTPAPVDMSTPSMAMTMTTDIGIEISQNNLHPLMALFSSAAFKPNLTCFDHFPDYTGLSPHISPVSRPWLVQLWLGLIFPRPIDTAIVLSPALRPATPVRRHHPGYW